MNGKDLYFVAVKVFMERNGKLLIMQDNFGDWDLPGGRIKQTKMLWVDPKVFKPENYFRGGWLKGVQEYLAKKYLYSDNI